MVGSEQLELNRLVFKDRPHKDKAVLVVFVPAMVGRQPPSGEGISLPTCTTFAGSLS